MATQRQKDLLKKYTKDLITIDPSLLDDLYDVLLTDAQINAVWNRLKSKVKPALEAKKASIDNTESSLESESATLATEITDMT